MEFHQYPKHRTYTNQIKMTTTTSTITIPSSSSQLSDNDRTSGELRALDCNLTSLCDHIQSEGFNSGSFSDVIVHAMGSTYHLHRLIISRSSYFRNMLLGPWKESNAILLTLNVDDSNVNGEAIAMALAYLYGQYPKLNDNNAFRVLAAASFLDLQDLCVICTDFIISELWTSNFLAYQVFAENQDYGIHGERVRNACWGYLCQSGYLELKEVLPKLSSQTLHALLTSDELWVPAEETRFELAMYTLIKKGTLCKLEHPERGSPSSEVGTSTQSGSSKSKGKDPIDTSVTKILVSKIEHLKYRDDQKGHDSADNVLVELPNSVVDFHTVISNSKQQAQQAECSQLNLDPRCPCSKQPPSLSNSSTDRDGLQSTCGFDEMPIRIEVSGMRTSGMPMEGPSEEVSCYHMNDNSWLPRDQPKHCSSMNASCDGLMTNEWGRCNMPTLSWGGRTVGKRQAKGFMKGNCGMCEEDFDAFTNIFEGGSLLFCNMSFEALLNVRKQLEELGFPCKAVYDSLWLQVLLSQRVQEVGADTCKNCCLVGIACACRQAFGFSHGINAASYYMQEQPNNPSGNVGNVYVNDSSRGGRSNSQLRPVRVHVRGPIDGLAGIGRGSTFIPAGTWPPGRFVFSRVPFEMGNRNCQQSLGNDDSESRADLIGDPSGDGLTALVGLSQGGNSAASIHSEQTDQGYDMDLQNRLAVAASSIAGPSTTGIPVQMLDSQDPTLEWEHANNSIMLDLKTPFSQFPPFRFGGEFEEVHRLSDGQVKHSQEVFYAGSLWKVSVQAFNDEDPQGRRTLGLFLHRRKAEITDQYRKVHMYVDSREKVTARYQLICPSKREVMVFGNFKQPGTLLPKAPKGWGWRSALLFDEVGDLLQNGALRVAAVVQLV